MTQCLLQCSLAATLAALVGLATERGGDEPASKLQVLMPSQAELNVTGINERGDLVGFEWADDPKNAGVVLQRPFYHEAKSQKFTYLPLLKGYTATFPEAVSDEGLVVGRVSRPAPPGAVVVPLRNLGFVWDATRGIRSLGVLEGDSASFASGISRDGRRVSGFSVGPYRVRACVWDTSDGGATWVGTPLPQTEKLGANTVPISPNGRFAAAVDGTRPCLWSRDDRGTWTREVIGEPASLLPRAVNDAGTVVGLTFADPSTPHAVAWSRVGGYRKIKEPAPYRQSTAGAVNNAGTIVGMLDGPPGSDVGPKAFVEENGTLRLLTEAGPRFAQATAINDRGQVSGVFEEPEHPEKPAPERP